MWEIITWTRARATATTAKRRTAMLSEEGEMSVGM